VPLGVLGVLARKLRQTGLGVTHVTVAAYQESCERASLAAFAWALFEAWLGAGAHPRDDWALRALAHFGDDETARRLADIAVRWVEAGELKRALVAVQVLGRAGSRAATPRLTELAAGAKAAPLRRAAHEALQAIAGRA
jgi:hypothetical protein